ncbi:hypothetical protein D1B17_06935 [Companilactobacillus zhachilii]|uniref:Uncharacterized protein n=1 Tax=Companilactobacillus zhachilii TaxID=2304606 RepID=A0A386PR63_9LACO|nr:hypothetical protein [Companilactobacillus zhachilii]AYE38384.1 hypothetical protein D1B17_06935 [Companilactobacillus zhachilii]
MVNIESFICWILGWEWTKIAAICAAATYIGNVIEKRKRERLKLIIQSQNLVQITSDGITKVGSGQELTIINSSNDLIFIEFLGIAKKYNIFSKFKDLILKYLIHYSYSFQKFYTKYKRKIVPIKFLDEEPKDPFDIHANNNLVKIKSGNDYIYKISSKNFIDAIIKLCECEPSIKKKFQKNKLVIISGVIRIYDKKLLETKNIFLPDNNPKSIYSEIKK